MSKIKSILILAFCLLLCVSATACGGSGNNPSSGDGNSTDSSGNSNSAEFEVPDELAGTSVKYATWIDESQTEAGPVIANFINETGINVEVVTVPQHEYLQKITAMISSDQAPDVFREVSEWPRLLQIAQPVENAGIDVNDPLWDQSIIKFGTVDGKAYLVNSVGSIWTERNMIVYNKEIFENNAITSPADYMAADNWTWDTFYKCLQDVKNSGVEFGGYIEPDYLANSVGAQTVKYENGVFINGTKDPLLQEAYVFKCKAQQEGLIDIALTSNDFINGKFGVLMCSTHACKATGLLSGMEADKIGYAMMPKYNKEQKDYTYSSYPLAWGIVDGATNPIGAGYFLRYYLDTENYKKAGSYDSAFKNEEAKEFYEEITSKGFTDGAGYIYISHGASQLVDVAGRHYLRHNLQYCSPLQVATNLQAVSNRADAVVQAANDVVAKVAEKYK